MAWGETPEVRGRRGSETMALRFPVPALATPATCFCLLRPGLFGVEPCMKSIAGLDFLLEVPVASNK